MVQISPKLHTLHAAVFAQREAPAASERMLKPATHEPISLVSGQSTLESGRRSVARRRSACPMPTIYSKLKCRRNFKFIGHFMQDTSNWDSEGIMSEMTITCSYCCS